MVPSSSAGGEAAEPETGAVVVVAVVHTWWMIDVLLWAAEGRMGLAACWLGSAALDSAAVASVGAQKLPVAAATDGAAAGAGAQRVTIG